ncbi:ribonuclease HII [Demequina zhanjiangensis]|uniref:Ribonuclease n=1 Tax=Demequina zhanjiangensis TaxID=3051659 RepID=A0ABT8G334_9MICO|nr:ribonuclease HII [Demequina sp. SYSU T00b26]MDN4473560.1 ribonuclease HII [Demequina sp. SYSU T00b26]
MRYTVSLEHERALWDAGARVVAGIDEVGRGALAGPVSVGVCALERRKDWPEGLADSKELTPARREAMAVALAGFGVARAVGHADASEIDEHGIVGALRLAGLRAMSTLTRQGVVVDAVLLDGTHDWLTPPAADLFAAASGDPILALVPDAPPVPPVTTVVKGDGRCASIAAGSVLAKVERDALMAAADGDHPAYGWGRNKGYGAPVHLKALRKHGPSPLHRLSWSLPARDL